MYEEMGVAVTQQTSADRGIRIVALSLWWGMPSPSGNRAGASCFNAGRVRTNLGMAPAISRARSPRRAHLSSTGSLGLSLFLFKDRF